MKRLFSNKSGFSLAEIIIAIAVFSIMMAMIMQMLQLSIAQRNANLKFANDLEQQQNALVVNGKDTTRAPTDPADPDYVDRDTMPEVKLEFKNEKTPDADPLEIDMKYQVKGTDDSDINNGLNYFVGDFDYDADGVGGADGINGGDSLGQTARYDTRITGTKGINKIKIGVTNEGSGKYKITVQVDATGMHNEDLKYSQIRLFFYSSTEFSSKKFETPKLDASGKPVTKDGETVMETYYKKVFNEAQITSLTWESGFSVDKATSNSIRIGVDGNGTGFGKGESAPTTTFYVTFAKDPGLTAGSFGANGSGEYSASPVYDEIKGTDTGKKHVNIYGSYPFDVRKPKADGSDPFK